MENESSISLGRKTILLALFAQKNNIWANTRIVQALIMWKIGWGGGRISVWYENGIKETQIKSMETELVRKTESGGPNQ